MDIEEETSAVVTPILLPVQVQRRRRRRKRSPVERVFGKLEACAPLLVLLGLVVLAGGVVRVVERGSAGGVATPEPTMVNPAVVAEVVQKQVFSSGHRIADPQRALAKAVHGDALERLDPEIDRRHDKLGFSQEGDPLDQILDWQLIEKGRSSSLEDSKFVVQDTNNLRVN